MTACVNKKSKRVTAVVTASLVGALSIGAPAVALATGSGDIDMLVAGDLEDIAAGKITAYTNQDGKTADSTEFKVGTEAQYIKPTEVTTKTGQVIDVAKAVEDNKVGVYYYQVVSSSVEPNNDLSDGTFLKWISDPSTIKGAGTYYVGVGDKSATGAPQLALMKFTIVNKSLKGATVVGKTVDDTELVYNGSDYSFGSGYLHIALNGSLVESSNIGSVEVYKSGATTTAKAHDAGKYVARVHGEGTYAGSVVEIPFEIKQLDLSEAKIALNQATVGLKTVNLPTALSKVNDSSAVNDQLDFSFVSSTVGSAPQNGVKGTFVYKVSVKDEKNTNIVNSANVEVVRYDKDATFKYDGKTIVAGQSIDLADPNNYDSTKVFDPSKVTVTDGKASIDFDIAYAKKQSDGTYVGVSDASKPGEYEATVTAKSSDCTYGGSVTIKFKVNATKIAVKDIFVTYDGKVTGDQLDVVYNGSDFLSQLKVSATDENGREVPAGELVLEAKEGTKAVDKIVDAGTYSVTVKAKDGSMYEVKGGSDSFQVVVSPIKLDKAVLHGTVKDYTDGKLASEFLPYTGSVLTPSWTFEDKDGAVEVPESAWKVSYDKEVKEEGDYTATFSRTVGTKNYDFTGLTKKFTVAEAKSFGDVENSDWFVGAVFQAKENGYVNGVKGTKLFNPKANITRADAVCILYNMAGGKKVEDMTKAEKLAWTSKVTFTDVNVDEYYGVAMGWADSLDIANGSNGKFRPTDTITREEFAALLSNYAKATGDYEAVDADEVLGSATDYTSWAKDVVAWAKANGIMGNNGAAINGTGVITRAEVAAMAVNYQPEAL